MLQPKTIIAVDQSKVIEAQKRKITSLILEYIECIEFFVEYFGQRAIFW